MKQVQIKTAKSVIMLFDLPREATRIRSHSEHGTQCLEFYSAFTDTKTLIPVDPIEKLDYKYLGKATELTEEDWRGIVDYNECPDPFLGKLKFYQKYPDSLNDNFVNTATESGLSLLKANGVEIENPLGDEPRFVPEEYDNTPEEERRFRNNLGAWCNIEDRLWRNTHIFIKQS